MGQTKTGKSQIRSLQRHAIFFLALPLQHSVQQLLSAALKRWQRHENMGSQYYNLRSANQIVGLILTACHCLAESCMEQLTLMEVRRLNCLSRSRRSVLQIALIKKNAQLFQKFKSGEGDQHFYLRLEIVPVRPVIHYTSVSLCEEMSVTRTSV